MFPTSVSGYFGRTENGRFYFKIQVWDFTMGSGLTTVGISSTMLSKK